MYSYSFYRCSSLGLFGLVIDHVQDIQDHLNMAVMILSEPPSTEPSTAKFFKILEYTQITVRQISSGSSQNWSIGTDFTHVPRVCRQ